jgi:hypothetical protein
MARLKNAFPSSKSGGYTARVRFSDETRGEKYFDTEWDISNHDTAGEFTIRGMTTWDGRLLHDPAAFSGLSIGREIKVGDRLSLGIRKWGRTGRPRNLAAMITVTGVEIVESGERKMTKITYNETRTSK